jgi:AraC-like DNA-binding protein
MPERARPRFPHPDLAPSSDASGSAPDLPRANRSTLFDISLPAGADAASFTIQGVQWRLPNVIIDAEIGGALVLERSRETIARHPSDQVVLHLLRSGKTVHFCDGRRFEMRPGDVAIFDYMRPVKTVASAFSSVTLAFSRSCAPAFMRNGALHGTVLAAGAGAARLIGAQIQTLIDVLNDLSPAEAEAAMEGLRAIAEAAWRRIDADAEAEVELRDRATAAIKARIGRSTLTPAAVANALGISRLQLSRLFAAKGGVGALILNLRLEACLKDMIEERGPGRISTIALHYRFSSEASFNRAFRKRFGRTPRQALALRDARPEGVVSIDSVATQSDSAPLDKVGSRRPPHQP